jgi:hypothetical protein
VQQAHINDAEQPSCPVAQLLDLKLSHDWPQAGQCAGVPSLGDSWSCGCSSPTAGEPATYMDIITAHYLCMVSTFCTSTAVTWQLMPATQHPQGVCLHAEIGVVTRLRFCYSPGSALYVHHVGTRLVPKDQTAASLHANYCMLLTCRWMWPACPEACMHAVWLFILRAHCLLWWADRTAAFSSNQPHPVAATIQG